MNPETGLNILWGYFNQVVFAEAYFVEWVFRKMVWILLGYTVVQACVAWKTWHGSPDHFSSWEGGSGDETKMCPFVGARTGLAGPGQTTAEVET